MQKLLKSLLSVTALCAVVPMPASALPEPCEVACSCRSSCTTKCSIGGSIVTCGFEQVCVDYCRAPGAQEASLPEGTEASEGSADALPVCGEEPQATSAEG